MTEVYLMGQQSPLRWKSQGVFIASGHSWNYVLYAAIENEVRAVVCFIFSPG